MSKEVQHPGSTWNCSQKPVEGYDIFTPAKQMQYHSGVGKGMHMMQYSWPGTYKAVYKLARHMTVAMQVHFDAMLRMMKNINNTNDRGLVLNPMQKCIGSEDHEFIISG
jgi:hypothetical protein